MLYWVRRPKGEKDLLIFDAGYEGGSIHIYEYRESIEVKEIQKQVEELLKYKPPANQVVRLWIETKYGVPITWKLMTP